VSFRALRIQEMGDRYRNQSKFDFECNAACLACFVVAVIWHDRTVAVYARCDNMDVIAVTHRSPVPEFEVFSVA
jgi:hypothetical protein